jgi:hypothetical protein
MHATGCIVRIGWTETYSSNTIRGAVPRRSASTSKPVCQQLSYGNSVLIGVPHDWLTSSDAVDSYERAQADALYVRSLWIAEGRPLVQQSTNGLLGRHPLWRVMLEAETHAARFRSELGQRKARRLRSVVGLVVRLVLRARRIACRSAASSEQSRAEPPTEQTQEPMKM